MPAKNKVLELLADQLLSRFDSGIDLIEDIIYPYKGFDPRKYFERQSNYRRSVDNLIARGLAEERSDKFYLTLKGKLELISASSHELKIKTPKWDGLWRVIAFDIPEAKRINRKYLREYLRHLGFKSIQKSLWITPNFIAYDDLVSLFDGATREKLVYFETDKVSNQTDLKKLFDLETTTK